MAVKDKIAAAKQFVEEWSGKGQEDEHCHKFWLGLMQDVLDVEDALSCIDFEKKVKLKGGTTKRIDGYIARTRVLIEQKSIDIDLDKKQVGHDGQTPFEQAKFYNDNINFDEKARWIIVSNFKEIRIYDMNNVLADPVVIMLSELPDKLSALDILRVEKTEQIRFEEQISTDAGRITGRLYNALIKQYADPNAPETLHSLNELCVRLVFCFYAEDAGEFKDNQFHDYIAGFSANHIRNALKDLFRILDTPKEERDPDDDPTLLAFPYVNGGLFRDDIRIPQFTDEIKTLLLDDACDGINWKDISPTIFGAVFESTLNPETRRSGGLHYTSTVNIHKVIDPMFLDDLKAEFAELKEISQPKTKQKKLLEFQDKIASLTFLDPACGSGNFLTETYLSLRRLENEVINEIYNGQIIFDDAEHSLIKVNIGQFYGIEINDYAVAVAMTALWIAESQMLKKTEAILNTDLNFLPLTTNANIHEGNALRMDWESVISKDKLNYIMGNPPFVGYSLQNKEQKDDILSVYVDDKGKPYKTAGKIDYVAGWYFKAAEYMVGTSIRTAFVSTNSITQGEQVAGVWKPLYDRFGIHIDYAYRTFRWDNRPTDTNGKKVTTDEKMAAVHVVIVGFSSADNIKDRIIFDNDSKIKAKNINAYLIDAPTVFVESRSNPIGSVAQMVYGNKPTDGGFLFLTPEERELLIKKEPNADKYIKRIYGATEYINNKLRYCIWLVGVSPSELMKLPLILERVEKVREFRLNSPKKETQLSADTPTLFQEIRHPSSDYIIVPRHSSENRKYIPFGFVSPDIIVNDAVQMIPDASVYEFGILTSNVHMAWVRAVCGRIKSDYRYSKDIVYNNFPWCTPTDDQKAKIEKTAQAILDARAKYPESSLADMYGENMYLFADLKKAHDENDAAVMAAYGFDNNMPESEIVAELMKMYQKLTEK